MDFAVAVAVDFRCSCGQCLREWLARGWECPGIPRLCPICFDPSAQPAWYSHVENHSWQNHDRCDAHNVCWSCLQQHVELKILDEGCWNVRCPGIGCKYHLVDDDVALVVSQSPLREKVLQRYQSLRSEIGTARLKEVLSLAVAHRKEAWVLHDLQACPRCLMLTQRHDGCPHLVCRCGCDFCFFCGAPHRLDAGEDVPCLCQDFRATVDAPSDEYVEGPHLALWLSQANREVALRHCLEQLNYGDYRAWPAWREHRRLLREAQQTISFETHVRFTGAMLGSWLWSAGADVDVPITLPGFEASEEHAYLAAAEEGSDVLPDLELGMVAETVGDDCVNPPMGRVRKVKRLTPMLGEHGSTSRYSNKPSARSHRSEVSGWREKSVFLKQKWDVRQRQHQLHVARQEKMMLSLE